MKALPTTLFTAVATACLAFPLYAGAQVSTEDYLFYDSFESGDMSATNDDGFRWTNGRARSLVTSTHRIWSASGPTNDPIPDGANWDPHPEGGDVSLRFRYRAGEAMSEQRFHLGQAREELWLRYWIRVPDNFTHGSGNPSNNKFFFIWGDRYNRTPEIGLTFWRSSQGSRLTYTVNAGGHRGDVEFIRSPDDRGRWMEVALHLKTASGEGANDGVFRFWRRWHGDSSFTKYFDRNDLDLRVPEGESPGFLQGYIMGWANAAYSEETEWLVDRFIVSLEPFEDVLNSVPPPSPPTGIKIETSYND